MGVGARRFDERQSPSPSGRPKKSDAAREALGRSRGGLTTKVHVAVDALGNPVHIHLSPGQEADCTHFPRIIEGLPDEVEAIVADKGYDTNTVVGLVEQREAEVVIPAKKNRTEGREIDENLYEDRNKVERFFGKIKQNRAVATRFDKKAACFLAVIHLAAIMVWLK